MSSRSANETKTSRREGSCPFSKANVSFAIDVSGSTYGRILECEKQFINTISNVLSSRAPKRVLPWSDEAGGVYDLRSLPDLFSGGGTDPTTLLHSSTTRASIQTSTIWFLLTDGLIDDHCRLAFTDQLTSFGLHGLTCIPVVFGSTGLPASHCNISVGVSVYSMCPNSAFLYYDVDTNVIYILQSKGIFNTLLRGSMNPDIDTKTTWHSLPRLSPDSFHDIILPAPKKLAKNEIQLDSFVINMGDIMANRVSTDQVNRIFSNMDNLSTVRMSAQNQGQQAQFQTWAQMQQMPEINPLEAPRNDVGGALTAFQLISNHVRNGTTVPEALRVELRAAHMSNMQNFLRGLQEAKTVSLRRKQQVRETSMASMTSITSPEALSRDWRPEADEERTEEEYQVNKRRKIGPGANKTTALSNPRQLLYTPGFRASKGSFRGPCTICGATGVILAWLFREHRAGSRKDSGPGASEHASSFVTGTLPELDVISSVICCEQCSTFCVSETTSFQNEAIVSALPMVRYRENVDLYSKKLQTALMRRDNGLSPPLSKDQIAAIFISALLVAGSKLDGSKLDETVLRAIEWTVRDVAASIQPGDPALEPGKTLEDSLAKTFRQKGKLERQLLQYPLQGLVPLLKAASLVGVTDKNRRACAFKRYLFVLTEALARQALGHESATVAANIKAAMAGLLWQEAEDSDFVVIQTPPATGPQTHPSTRSADGTRTRAASVPMQSLRGTALLSEEDWALMQKMEEFRYLQDPEISWVGHATAVFLPALLDVAEKHHFSDGFDLFKLVSTRKELSPIFVHPEACDVNKVVEMLASLRL